MLARLKRSKLNHKGSTDKKGFLFLFFHRDLIFMYLSLKLAQSMGKKHISLNLSDSAEKSVSSKTLIKLFNLFLVKHESFHQTFPSGF